MEKFMDFRDKLILAPMAVYVTSHFVFYARNRAVIS